MRHLPAFPPFLPLVAIESASYHITRHRTLSLSMDGLARKDADEFVVRANDVIFFKLIRHESEVEDHEKESFHPEFTHQVFGESENIFGYKDLKIVIFYSSGHLRQYVSISFKEKIPASVSKGVEPDDVIGQIREHVSDKFTSNINQFTERLADEAAFRPAGEKVNQIIVQKKDSTGSRLFEVYHSDMAVPGFRQQHEQMQTWLLWMIDGASYIDPDDERWEFLTIYEKTGSEASATNGSGAHRNGSAAGSRYHFVGYCTVYRYFAYPDKLRPRISQFLILPPFQRQGLGAHLLQSLYDRYRGQESVVDIAVEDPAENFSKLRDFVDTRNCMSLPEFSSENIAKGWSNEMAQSAQSKLKLNRIQVRRVYEILKLKSIDRKDEDAFRAYRLEVKNRLNAPFLKNKFTDANPVTDEVRMTSLQNMFDEAVLEYDETIQKLDAMS